jgi:hypothetical protein
MKSKIALKLQCQNAKGNEMNLRKICSVIAKVEGKKSQVKIGDVREIMKFLIAYEAAVDIVNKQSKRKQRGPCTVIQMEANKLKKKKGFDQKALAIVGGTK